MAYPGLSLYKLMILFMLEKVTFPLSNNQIVDFLLNRSYTDYFHAQEAISDLLSSGQISSEVTRRSTLYTVTEEGMQTITSLENMIDAGIRAEIIDYPKENSFTLRSESGVRSDYRLTPSREYEVRLEIIEQGTPLLSMTINVMSKEEAETMCSNWSAKNQELYLNVMRTLLRAPEDGADGQ